MDERLIICGGLPGPRRPSASVVELDKGPNAPPHKRVELRLDTLSEQLADNIKPLLCDAVEIAAYVLTADRLVTRGTDRMGRMGADWRRRLAFRIPVRRADLWQSHEIYECLTETLAFLSEDEFRFEFEQADPATRLDPFLGFQDPAAHRIKPDEVILFSGGLDSLAGAVETLAGSGRAAALVTHKSSNTIAARQDALVERLQAKLKAELFYAPVWVRKGDYEPVEHTQRTRSFLFVTLGIAVARMFGLDKVLFFENGITSFNLPIAEHVIGTRASRTTHPKVLNSFSRLFSLLMQRTIFIENRFLWHTKRDVVDTLKKRGCVDLIRATTSCAQVRNFSMTTKQCGACSQCIERRFAVLAADLKDHEPADDYQRDLFVGATEKAIDITMAEQHVLRAARLAKMSEPQFLAEFGQVFRALPDLALPQSTAATKVFELHQRYGRELMEVVNAELRANADFQLATNLPPTSLLAMINAPSGISLDAANCIPAEPAASVQAAADPKPVKQRRLAIAIDESRKEILLSEGVTVRGASFKLIARLAKQLEADLAKQVLPKFHEYVPTETLVADLKVIDQTLRQRVMRARKLLNDAYEKRTGYVLDDEDVIQSVQYEGYRLNPYLLLVAPAQIRRS